MDLNEDLLSLDIPLPPDIARRKAVGDLAGAIRLIDRYLERDCPELAPRLRCEKVRLERLSRDYPYDRAAAIARMREEWPDPVQPTFDTGEQRPHIVFTPFLRLLYHIKEGLAAGQSFFFFFLR